MSLKSAMKSECNATAQYLNSSDHNYGCLQNTTFPYQSQSIFETVEFNLTLYCLIFLLSLGGNALVIITLFREKKMRTITNLFLLNLAASDLMLSMLCMPFSLVATIILRNFVFGQAMCIIIRYFQGKVFHILRRYLL